MFKVSTNIEKTISKKKKLLFISTLSSNEISSFEAKNFENSETQYQAISKSSSLSDPLPLPKKNKKFCDTDNNFKNHKRLPIKRIFFHLYHVNILNQKKEKGRTQFHNQKDNNFKKNGTFNLKHKQRHIQVKNNNTSSFSNKNYSSGRWKSDEHQRFIDAIIRYGNNWRQVQKCVGTRTSTQTRSHAQKFFEKLKRSKIFKREKYDFSKNSLKILHDIMKNLPDKEFNQVLKALHSLSYDRNHNNEKDENKNQIINEFDNYNNNENIIENNNNDGNNNINNEEKMKNIKFSNQGYFFLENNSNKLYNNEDYMFYNISNNVNINSNFNNYIINDYSNCDIKPYGRKESDILSQRKNSLSELNLNIKDLKEQNNNIDDFNLNYNLYENYNNFSLNIQQDNKNINNKIYEEDKIDYRQQFTNLDYLFNQQTSRKMSLEEKVIN